MASAFFSGSETALFSMNQLEFNEYRKSSNKLNLLISKLYSRPQELLIVVLTGNLFVNILLGTVTNELVLGLFPTYGPVITVVLLTPIVIFFGEVIPKNFALAHAPKVRRYIILPIFYFNRLIFPLTWILTRLTDRLLLLFRYQHREHRLSVEELEASVKVSEQSGALNQREGRFILNILKMEFREAQHVMIHRNDLTFIEKQSTVKKALTIFQKSGQRFLPVIQGSRDNIVGFLFLKDIIGVKYAQSRARQLNRLIVPAAFYPHKKDLFDLLREMKESSMEVAVILDEFGGTAGIVDLRDIISFIMGYSTRHDPKAKIRKVNKQQFSVLGDILMDDFNDIFHTHLSSNSSSTLSGYLIEIFGKIPRQGESLVLEDHTFIIVKIDDNKVEKILLNTPVPSLPRTAS